MNKADYPAPSPKSHKTDAPAGDALKVNSPQALGSEVIPKAGSKESDLFVLAQKLRQRNRTLQDQVAQLQESLQIAEEKLLRQSEQFSAQESIRSQEVGTILSQQTAEADYANEQVGRLLQELEISHQLAQRQQILIETLSSELQISQERVAQLERECALTQQQYNEQCHELLQSENRCQELNTRLQRQQRQALQFKLALEKSLEVPTTNIIGELAEPEELAKPRKINLAALSLRSTQPIQPWSQVEAAIESPEPEADFALPTSSEMIFTPEIPALPEPKELRIDPRAGVIQPLLLALHLSSEGGAIEPRFTPEQEAKPEVQGIPELFQLGAAPEPLPELLFDVTAVGSDSPVETLRERLALPLEKPVNSENPPLVSDLAQYLQSLKSEPEVLEISANDQKLQALLAAVKRAPYIPPESNKPAPIVYPERPSKKIPSLSAIDLPNFPRHRPPEN
ncbi:MAG: hypothetical protein HC916_00395 [Coleofasciculaceae cyanobacterium SM2_1_6]|nr:hypothetical protein [Coleofasciculaceae cyanobacterium SM2_1_6]